MASSLLTLTHRASLGALLLTLSACPHDDDDPPPDEFDATSLGRITMTPATITIGEGERAVIDLTVAGPVTEMIDHEGNNHEWSVRRVECTHGPALVDALVDFGPPSQTSESGFHIGGSGVVAAGTYEIAISCAQPGTHRLSCQSIIEKHVETMGGSVETIDGTSDDTDITCDLEEPSGPQCGNGSVDETEDCDMTDLAGESCVTRGFDGGTLTCTSECTFDTSMCEGEGPQCGDGIREGAEECDGIDLGDAACPDGTGTLSCNDDCTLDESSCGGVTALEGEYMLATDDAQMQSLAIDAGVPEDIMHGSFNAFVNALAGAPGEGYMAVGGRFEASGNPPFVAFAGEDGAFTNVSPPDELGPEQAAVDVAYGDGTWVAIGGDGSIRTEDRGETWAYSPDPADLGSREELAFGNGAFVLARGDYSTDGGVTWSVPAEPPFNGAATNAGIGFGNGRFVAVGRDGPSGLGGSPYSCISEDGGAGWTCYLLPFAQVGALSTTAAVVYGDGRWVFGGQHLPYILLFSDDGGETWTTGVFPIVDEDAMISDITYNPDVGFLATVEVGFGDAAILHSVDGETWTQVGEVLTDTRYVGAASIP